jgi:hypothetical protein
MAVNAFDEIDMLPAVTSIAPPVVTAGTGDTQLVLNGKNFIRTSMALLNGKQLRTEFVSVSELSAMAPSELLQKVGTLPVTVSSPGRGVTRPTFLIVKYR